MYKSFSDVIGIYKELEKLPEKLSEKLILWGKSNHLDYRRILEIFSHQFVMAEYKPIIKVRLSVLFENRSITREEVPLEMVKQDGADPDKEADIWEREYYPPAQYIEDSFLWMLPRIYEMKNCSYCGKIDPSCRYCKGGGKLALVEHVKVQFKPDFIENDYSDHPESSFLKNFAVPMKIYETETENCPETFNLSEKYTELVKKSLSSLDQNSGKLRRLKIELFVLPVLEVTLKDVDTWYVFGEELNFFIPNVNKYRIRLLPKIIAAGIIGIMAGAGLFLYNGAMKKSHVNSVKQTADPVMEQKNKFKVAIDFLNQGNLRDAATALSTAGSSEMLGPGLLKHIESFSPKQKYYSPDYCFTAEVKTGLWPEKIYFLDGKIDSVDFYCISDGIVSNSKINRKINGYAINKLSLSKIELIDDTNLTYSMMLPLNRGVDRGISFIKQFIPNKKQDYNGSFTVNSFQIMKSQGDTGRSTPMIAEISLTNPTEEPWNPEVYIMLYNNPPAIDRLIMKNLDKTLNSKQTERLFLNPETDISGYKYVSVLTWNDINNNLLINNKFFNFLNSKKKSPLIQNSQQLIKTEAHQLKISLSTSDDGKQVEVSYSFEPSGKHSDFAELFLYNQTRKLVKTLFLTYTEERTTLSISLSDKVYFFSVD